MNSFIKSMQVKGAVTDNGMPTHTTSGNYCLDLFGAAGATRGWTDDMILSAFSKALDEDPLLTMKILFWARDIRGGAGERRFFRVCINYLNEVRPEYLEKNLHLVPEYGRWDDLFHFENEAVLSLISTVLAEGNGLCAKWLPRKGPFANKVRKFLKMSPKEYRRLIVGLSKTVEQDMCAKNWSNITYEHVPSQAMNKYRKAYFRNDGDRFGEFINAAVKGEVEIKADTLFPYQLYLAYMRSENRKAVEAQWKALPNFMEGATERILPLCDVSGSMHNFGGYGTSFASTTKPPGGATPMSISVSLGIYISERNEGPYKDAFMTFSGDPQLQVLKGSFYDRCQQLERADWSMNTDLTSAFDRILDSAVRANVPVEDMPTMLLIISDMQFDRCVRGADNTALEMIDNKYAGAGYKRPTVVFWNVNAMPGQSPVRYDDNGTAVISGFTPAVLKAVLNGTITDPVVAMMNAVMSKRYEAITI